MHGSFRRHFSRRCEASEAIQRTPGAQPLLDRQVAPLLAMTILDTTCPVNRLLDETPMPAWSQTFTFLDGEWHEGNHPFVGARTHAFWLGSSVFDGARAFEGVTPDLDKHFARLNRSAETMCLTPTMSVEAMLDLAKEGLKKFSPGAELYIRPMYWPEGGSATSAVAPDADSTRFCLCIYEAPLPAPTGVSITRSPYAKPLAVTMPIEAKAGCLYPNNGRALIEARARGFDNCLMCDMIGNVAELATANIFMARDGVVMTPIANGSFLSGVTRQRVIELLRADGKDAREATLGFADFDGADEIFVVGNYGKVTPVRRIDGRDLQPGPFFHRARKLYWEYAHSC
jgi:branched-chain amino acid aminotransferase